MTKLYQNKEWLKKKYWDEKLSTGQIGEICDVDYRIIWSWMKKLNIPRRSYIQDNIGYKNKKWLKKKYIDEGLTTIEIGKFFGVGDGCIGRNLRRLNINSRSRSEAAHLPVANHCNLSQEAIEWINGELLGDGSIQSISPYSAYFAYSSKHLEYIKYVKDTLKSFGINGGNIIKRYHTKEKTGFAKQDYYSYFYRSYCYVELFSFRKKWYPNGIKIIPKDLILTPLTLRQHYIGDGSLCHPKNGRPYAWLYTNGFSITDVEWLVNQLNKIGFRTTRQPAVNSIRIFAISIEDFLDYIGDCPIQCYRYKWNLKEKEVTVNV